VVAASLNATTARRSPLHVEHPGFEDLAVRMSVMAPATAFSIRPFFMLPDLSITTTQTLMSTSTNVVAVTRPETGPLPA
jgi:hypothetical protein